MYVKVLVSTPKVISPSGVCFGPGQIEVFVGPFKSEKARTAFIKFWEGESILKPGEIIKFLPRKNVPMYQVHFLRKNSEELSGGRSLRVFLQNLR